MLPETAENCLQLLWCGCKKDLVDSANVPMLIADACYSVTVMVTVITVIAINLSSWVAEYSQVIWTCRSTSILPNFLYCWFSTASAINYIYAKSMIALQ